MVAGSRAPIAVLEKVGLVLNLLAEHWELTATEIADLLDEPRSSVYRLLRALRERGYVEQPRRGVFTLGLRLFELGYAVAARFNLRDAALPAMQRVHEATEDTVLLFIERDGRAVCIERLDGRNVRLEIVDVGESLPLHSGAAPRLLLAYSNTSAIDEYLGRAHLEPLTVFSPTTAADVRGRLAEVVDHGYAVSDQDLVLGVASIAAPIRDHRGVVVAAISYSGLAATLLRDRTVSVKLVREAAAEASRRLGWLPEGDDVEAAANTVGARYPISH